MDMQNKIGVIERFEKDHYSLCAGNNRTNLAKDFNPFLKKEIPIYPIRDYWIPNEFEGIGEPEVIRWQQYEENKIHNLSFLSMLMNTVQRYGIVEQFLVDPKEAESIDPIKPIRLKYIMGADINKALMPLNQRNPYAYPQKFLNEVKAIGQSATGISDFFIGGNKAMTNTATEANKMASATELRIARKIIDIAERDLKPILYSWLISAPIFYDEELDFLLNDEKDMWIKYLPHERDDNKNIDLILEASQKEKIYTLQDGTSPKTLEQLYLGLGYQQVVFASDLRQKVDITIKTTDIDSERQEKINQFALVIKLMQDANTAQPPSGFDQTGKPIPGQPVWDISKAIEDALRQFPNIVSDPKDYKYNKPATLPAQMSAMPLNQ